MNTATAPGQHQGAVLAGCGAAGILLTGWLRSFLIAASR
jgi:hypothetical protein